MQPGSSVDKGCFRGRLVESDKGAAQPGADGEIGSRGGGEKKSGSTRLCFEEYRWKQLLYDQLAGIAAAGFSRRI